MEDNDTFELFVERLWQFYDTLKADEYVLLNNLEIDIFKVGTKKNFFSNLLRIPPYEFTVKGVEIEKVEDGKINCYKELDDIMIKKFGFKYSKLINK
ncbi:MAG: hypothetical protein IPJ13_26315 [Saprospiraceae bacterium]|nr:hypothetical protein [Saprospiraceae bacterium]